MNIDDTSTLWRVVVNHEQQFSIWPEWRELPAGWTTVGVEGDRQTCLDWIAKEWTDMRPQSLRRAMAIETKADDA